MSMTKTEDYHVFIRACEGLPLLVLAALFLIISWMMNRDALF